LHADLHSRLCRFAALHPLDRAAGLTKNADLQHSRLCRFAALDGAAGLTRKKNREDPDLLPEMRWIQIMDGQMYSIENFTKA
jgi:hypothetical protein